MIAQWDEDDDGSNDEEEEENGEPPSQSSHRKNLGANLQKSEERRGRGSTFDSNDVDSEYGEMKGMNPTRQDRGYIKCKNTVIIILGDRINGS